jgi:hypothetical protein
MTVTRIGNTYREVSVSGREYVAYDNGDIFVRAHHRNTSLRHYRAIKRGSRNYARVQKALAHADAKRAELQQEIDRLRAAGYSEENLP